MYKMSCASVSAFETIPELVGQTWFLYSVKWSSFREQLSILGLREGTIYHVSLSEAFLILFITKTEREMESFPWKR